MITTGRHSYVCDEHGKKYIDFTSGGIFAAVLGANNSILRAAASKAPLQCCYGGAWQNPVTERYKDMLREFTGYESVALFSTGSEATEAFWRAARVYTGKPYVWGGLIDPDQVGSDKPDPLYDAMHGWTFGAMVMAGRMKMQAPGCFDWLGSDFGSSFERTGAAIFEPYHAPSGQFHRESPTIDRIRSHMRTFEGMLWCCDEVQGGFGRTGKLFGHEWYMDFRPDFVCAGKAMGGGYPLSALLGPKEVMEDPKVIEYGHLHSTHSGHPVMAAVGIEVINQIDRLDLISKSAELGNKLNDLLKDCGVRYHAGKGLMAGLEFRDAEEAGRVVEACERRGLLVVNTGRKWVKLGPPFIISEKALADGVNILKQAIEEVLDGRIKAK